MEVSPDFRPWRLAIAFEQVEPTPIRPLLAQLGFIADPQRWGMVFRRGLFEVPEADLDLIAGALRAGRRVG